MEAQLEILCRQPSTESQSQQQLQDSSNPQSFNTNNRGSANGIDCNSNDGNNNNSNNNSPWLGQTIQCFLNKLRELTKSEKPSHHHKHVEEDWDVPFERIRICQNDFQRCGTEGDVFYGKLSNTPVAVKRVKDVSLTKIRHLMELNHKNVIKFRGVSQNFNYYYILMQWCPYGTLHDHIHSGRQLSSKILSDFTYQIANGMKYLHSKNIIHLDLKPSNILLTHHDVLKISDFGTHKVVNDKSPINSFTCVGTAAYMAPEVIRSDTYSFPVDIWSYGIVVWEVLTGDEPYKNLSSSSVLWEVGQNAFRPPVPSTFPEGFSRILRGCWKALPNERLTFQQICMIIKGAMHEVDKISKERWLPLQAEWKREIRSELDKNLEFKNEPNEDQLCRQKVQVLQDAVDQAQKRKHKNDNLYLKLQECSMLLRRDREEIARREESVSKREQAILKLESESSERNHEMNRLNEKLSLIIEELNLRGIKLNCLQEEDNQSGEADNTNL